MLYLFGNYVNDTLQFLPQEEGRIRPTSDVNNPFVYDYFLKDHLGNVRMMLTEEVKTDAYPAASMETAQATTEEALYSNLNTTRTDKPAGYPNDTYTNPNDKVAKVSGSGNKIGPAIVLKVMAGDKFNLRVSSWYKTYGATPGTPNPLTELASALANSVAGVSGGKTTALELNNTGVSTSAATSFLNTQSYNTSKPKAYINWMVLDEQFKYYAGGAEQVGDNEEFKTHVRTELPVDKCGYLYIYTSNETPNIDVFFDNLQVTHTRGPLLETNQYYPFGLTMAGISSKAAGGVENKKKYNGIEFENDLEIQTYTAFFRELDPQTGRWWQIDPVTDGYENLSPYASMYDNPMRYSDPLGNEGEDCCWDVFVGAVEDVLISASGVVNGMLNTGSAGLISTDPFSFRDKLSGDKLALYDRSVMVGQIGPLLMPGGSRGSVKTPSLQPVNGPPIPVVITRPILLTPPIPVQVNTEHKKNARKSTKQDHEAGQARGKQDREGSKGMVDPPRKRPPGHSGPYPPKKPTPKPVPVPPPPSGGN